MTQIVSFNKQNVYLFISLLATANICLSIIFMFTSEIFSYGDYSMENSVIDGMSPKGIFILSVVFAPLIETYVLQFLPIELLMAILSKYKCRFVYFVAVSLSALLFAATHYFNFIYFFETFLIGIILGFGYMHICIFYKKSSYLAFFAIVFVHSFHNLFAFVYNNFAQ